MKMANKKIRLFLIELVVFKFWGLFAQMGHKKSVVGTGSFDLTYYR